MFVVTICIIYLFFVDFGGFRAPGPSKSDRARKTGLGASFKPTKSLKRRHIDRFRRTWDGIWTDFVRFLMDFDNVFFNVFSASSKVDQKSENGSPVAAPGLPSGCPGGSGLPPRPRAPAPRALRSRFIPALFFGARLIIACWCFAESKIP